MSVRSKSYKKSKIVEAQNILTKINPLTNMSTLTDINLTRMVDLDILKYNTGTGKWTSFRNPLIQSFL